MSRGSDGLNVHCVLVELTLNRKCCCLRLMLESHTEKLLPGGACDDSDADDEHALHPVPSPAGFLSDPFKRLVTTGGVCSDLQVQLASNRKKLSVDSKAQLILQDSFKAGRDAANSGTISQKVTFDAFENLFVVPLY